MERWNWKLKELEDSLEILALKSRDLRGLAAERVARRYNCRNNTILQNYHHVSCYQVLLIIIYHLYQCDLLPFY